MVTQDLERDRRVKFDQMVKLGYTPPYNFNDTEYDIAAVRSLCKDLKPGDVGSSAFIHGRVKSHRDQGKIIFVDIYDQNGHKIQTIFSPNHLGSSEAFQAAQLLDLGDWISVEGNLIVTKRGEYSIQVSNWQILSKCLKPGPDPHSGMGVEIRSRRPWYYLRFDELARQKLITRSGIKNAIRDYLSSAEFIEVDTPILSHNYGGAAARPFTSHCNDLNEDLFLSIAPEPFLKEAIVGGMERVYTIARNFRNEGIDTTHNPEFEMLECYQVGSDYFGMMDLLESICVAARNVCGLPASGFEYQGHKIDIGTWRRISMRDAVLDHLNHVVGNDADDNDVIDIARNELGHDVSLAMAYNHIFETQVQATLIQPTIIYDYPAEISPLTRAHRSKPGWVERFEAFVCGMEIANSYTECVDAQEQENRLRSQRTDEKYPVDEDFIDAIYCGLPPTGGLGLGIDRLVMILTNSTSIRDVILAPLVATDKN